MSEFSKLGLSLPLTQAVHEAGYVHPTPIQASAIPPIAAGRDLLGIAQTGTGKTAAFALPILERLLKTPGKAPSGRTRVLVLTPTRELASQIEASFRTYGKHQRLSTAVVFGGVGQGRQVDALRRGLDVLIATPGRLLDLMQQRHAHLDKVEIFVLDEADRMLDMGFIRDIRKITPLLPKDRQTLLFSATMPTEIAGLAHELLSNPEKVEVTPPASTVDRVQQSLYFVHKDSKRDLLKLLLADQNIFQALVFTRTKHRADRVAEFLNREGVPAEAIHGNKAQNHRERTLRSFRSGSLRVLVATDIAARGLDIPGVSHVFNFELPDEPDSYVHRIGRTARAGREGVAIAFCGHEELEQLRDIERLTARTLEVVTGHPFDARLQKLPERGRGQGSPRPNFQRQRQAQGPRPERSSGGPRGERSGPGARPEGYRRQDEHGGPGRNDRPRHEGARPAGSEARPQGSGPRSDSRGPKGPNQRRRGRGASGPGERSSGSSPKDKGLLGGMFKAIKKSFGG